MRVFQGVSKTFAYTKLRNFHLLTIGKIPLNGSPEELVNTLGNIISQLPLFDLSPPPQLFQQNFFSNYEVETGPQSNESCAQINRWKVTQSLTFLCPVRSIISPYYVTYLLWVFGALEQFGENSPRLSNHEQGYNILIVILPIIGGILQSISTDIVLTIKSNLAFFYCEKLCCYFHDTTLKFAYLYQSFTRITSPDCHHIQIRMYP